MPEKIRQLKKKLRKAGFVYRPAKGSHTVWYDPLDPDTDLRSVVQIPSGQSHLVVPR